MQSELPEYRLLRSPRRSRIAIRIAPDGVVELLVPPLFPDAMAQTLLERHRSTIRRLRERAANLPQAPTFAEGEIFWYLGKPYPLHRSRRLCCFDGERFHIPAGMEGKKTLTELYRDLGKTFFPERTEYWSEQTGFRPQTVHVSSATTRWGSCSSRGVIVFSWRLICCPDELIDYVVVHELCHLKELNHSPRFWAQVARVLPDWKSRRAALNRFGLKLPRF